MFLTCVFELLAEKEANTKLNVIKIEYPFPTFCLVRRGGATLNLKSSCKVKKKMGM